MRSPAAKEAAAVRRWRWMGVAVSRREREKGAVKVDLSGLTAVKGKAGLP
jgi:hypothetical protein